MNKLKNIKNLYLNIFIFANILSFFTLFFFIRAGLIISLTGLFSLIFLANFRFPLKPLIIIFIFILYQIFSFFPYLFLEDSKSLISNNPILLFQSFSYILIPQLIFLVLGLYCGKENLSVALIKRILLSNFILLLLSIFLHVSMPEFYINYLKNLSPESYEYHLKYMPRLKGYMGTSMILGVIASSSVFLSIGYIKSKTIKLIFLLIFIIASILTMQRGSWIAILIGFLILFFLTFSRETIKTALKTSVLIFLIFIAIYFLFIDNKLFDIIINYAKIRFLNITSAPSERLYQWENILYILNESPIFGLGTGSLNHKAANVGFEYSIPDGNYLRILGELGIIGFLLFIVIVGISLRNSFHKNKYLFIALIVYLFQAIGTNVFDLYYASFIFWTLIGINLKIK